MRIKLILMVAGLLAGPAMALAQSAPRTPARRFDAEVAYLTFSWVGRPSASFALGPEIGVGFLQQVVVSPSGDELTGLAHLGITSTIRLSGHVDGELGIRAAAGELRSVACAGCAFSGHYGVVLAVFAGGRRVRIGTRVTKGKIEGSSLFTWSPVALRVQF